MFSQDIKLTANTGQKLYFTQWITVTLTKRHLKLLLILKTVKLFDLLTLIEDGATRSLKMIDNYKIWGWHPPPPLRTAYRHILALRTAYRHFSASHAACHLTTITTIFLAFPFTWKRCNDSLLHTHVQSFLQTLASNDVFAC